MATMLGFLTTDAAVAPALLQRALRGARRRHVQRHHRRRRVLDQRLRVRAGQRRERRALDEATTARCWSTRCARSASRSRIGIVRGGEGATKLITVHVTGAASRRRRQADGARDRQLAAGEDRDSRRRSELGPPGRRRRPLRRRRSSSIALRCGSGRSSCSANGRPHDERAPAGGRIPQGQGDRGRSRSRHRRRRHVAMWTCDLSAEYVRINAEYRT